ncbi:unnamed protein product [Paramecium octaurelia]|uniref:Uncharacterized protein n=1 Tax=Paramecium octaurelia TaxID=43137 RepID=A0A8S1VVT6_PAROT|nr:unnamed protein product [Paramecium octaurelia]
MMIYLYICKLLPSLKSWLCQIYCNQFRNISIIGPIMGFLYFQCF